MREFLQPLKKVLLLLLLSGCLGGTQWEETTVAQLIEKDSAGAAKLVEYDEHEEISETYPGMEFRTVLFTGTIEYQKDGWIVPDAMSLLYVRSKSVLPTVPAEYPVQSGLRMPIHGELRHTIEDGEGKDPENAGVTITKWELPTN